jgi:G:T-mismatch repair DNA endonuclease (very short patch repair protein)
MEVQILPLQLTLKPKLMREQVDFTGEEISEEYKETANAFMHDWIFHYNPYEDRWAAIPRDNYTDYWNDRAHKNILRSKHLNTLIDLLYKCKGSVDCIEDLTRGEVY